MVEKYAQARQQVRELTAKLDATKREDDEGLRAAVLRGTKVPTPKAGIVEAELLGAQRAQETLG